MDRRYSTEYSVLPTTPQLISVVRLQAIWLTQLGCSAFPLANRNPESLSKTRLYYFRHLVGTVVRTANESHAWHDGMISRKTRRKAAEKSPTDSPQSRFGLEGAWLRYQ